MFIFWCSLQSTTCCCSLDVDVVVDVVVVVVVVVFATVFHAFSNNNLIELVILL